MTTRLVRTCQDASGRCCDISSASSLVTTSVNNNTKTWEARQVDCDWRGKSIGIARRIETTAYTSTERKKESAPGKRNRSGPKIQSRRVGMCSTQYQQIGQYAQEFVQETVAANQKTRESIPRQVLSSMCVGVCQVLKYCIIILSNYIS
jgi:hypothetical protein